MLLKKLKTFAQLSFIIIPIIAIIKTVDFNAVRTLVKELPLWIFPLLFLIYFTRNMLQTYRFFTLIHPFTKTLTYIRIFLIDMKARYYSIIVPSSFGYDATRGYILRKEMSVKQIVATSFMFRLTGIIPLFFLSIVGLLIAEAKELTSYRWMIILFFMVFLSLAVFIMSPSIQALLRPWLKRLILPITSRLPQKVSTFVHTTAETILLYKHHPKTVLSSWILGFAMQLAIIFTSVLIIFAITKTWYVSELILFIPIIEIICMLAAFSPNGYGVRELLFLFLFNHLGIARESLVLYIGLTIIELLVRLVGLGVILEEKYRLRKVKETL